MRRVVLALSLVSVVALLGAAAPATTSTSTAFSFSLQASVAGGVVRVSSGEPATFVFTTTNRGATSAEAYLVITKINGAATPTTQTLYCRGPNGIDVSFDGFFCEPGLIKPGQTTAVIIQTNAAASVPRVSVRACVFNPGTGVFAPCVTLSVASDG